MKFRYVWQFIAPQEVNVRFHPDSAHENRQRAGSCRQVLAMGTALLLALYPVVPTRAATPGGAASPKAAAAAPAHASSAGGCQLKSPGGKIKHVVEIIFDNVHFRRDPARDGSTLVPSDIEQMPHLLNFIKNNGVLLTNHHTQLIAHTSDDILTNLTGVYP